MIRDATHDDIHHLAATAASSGVFTADDEAFLRDLFAEAVRTDEVLLVAQDEDGTCTGTALARPEQATDRTWDLTLIAVDASTQRSGVGRALMSAVEQRLQRDGQRLLLVRTSSLESFAGARAFYAGLGYDEEARIRDRWADGDDDITFSKRLRPAAGH